MSLECLSLRVSVVGFLTSRLMHERLGDSFCSYLLSRLLAHQPQKILWSLVAFHNPNHPQNRAIYKNKYQQTITHVTTTLILIIYHLLFIMYSLLFSIYCLLFIIYHLLFIIYYLLFIVYCLLSTIYYLLFIIYYLLFIVYYR